MEKLAFFGKGGVGKSTISTNISAVFARQGKKVLHVGCDPKNDSSTSLLGSRPPRTVIGELLQNKALNSPSFIIRSRLSIDCVESGGPTPGVGCGGRGIILAIEQLDKFHLLSDGKYDAVVFDVLGDIVCGGFAAPLRAGFAQKVVIVVSEELMSMYAANNIAKMIPVYASNNIALCGLVVNLRVDTKAGRSAVTEFARRLNTTVLEFIPRDPLVTLAERERRPVVELNPNSPISELFNNLVESIVKLDINKTKLPTPMDDDSLDDFFKGLPPVS